MDLRLGTLVRFEWHTRLRRTEATIGGGRYQKVWVPASRPPEVPEVRTGVIVGKRTLADGEAQYYASDEPVSWSPKHHFEAYLVAYDLRRRPVYVLVEDIEVVEEPPWP